jgi:serine protease AprX
VFSFSNRGPSRNGGQKPDLVGPGGPVESVLAREVPVEVVADRRSADGLHWRWEGTSMAAAHVTGMVAILLQQNGRLTPSEVRARLTEYEGNPYRMGYDPAWGFGKARLSCGAPP